MTDKLNEGDVMDLDTINKAVEMLHEIKPVSKWGLGNVLFVGTYGGLYKWEDLDTEAQEAIRSSIIEKT